VGQSNASGLRADRGIGSRRGGLETRGPRTGAAAI
jgi:hypothetical protein